MASVRPIAHSTACIILNYYSQSHTNLYIYQVMLLWKTYFYLISTFHLLNTCSPSSLFWKGFRPLLAMVKTFKFSTVRKPQLSCLNHLHPNLQFFPTALNTSLKCFYLVWNRYDTWSSILALVWKLKFTWPGQIAETNSYLLQSQ